MIRLKELHIGYEDVLLRVSHMELQRGQLYLLMGRNGAGKSSLLKTISGQIKALSGECSIDSKSIASFEINELPKKITFVSPRSEIVDFMTVTDFIALGRSPYTGLFGKLSKEDKNKVDQAIAIVGISELSNRFLSELSDGERQLASIAQAICQETDLIILDEPTAFLDYTNKTMIIRLLEKLVKEQNLCVIVSSHDVDICLNSKGKLIIIDQEQKELVELDSSISKEEFIKKTY